MRKSRQLLSVIGLGLVALLSVSALHAAGDHGHDHDDHGASMKGDHDHDHDSDKGHKGHDHKGHDNHKSMMNDMFLLKKKIDGYDVSFHVMKAKPGKEMGGTHDFMIKVEKNGKVVTDIVMNTKVKHPNGKAETKKAMKMGDWLMAGYDLGHKGKHQLMILFKTADGKKHKGGVYYPGE